MIDRDAAEVVCDIDCACLDREVGERVVTEAERVEDINVARTLDQADRPLTHNCRWWQDEVTRRRL